MRTKRMHRAVVQRLLHTLLQSTEIWHTLQECHRRLATQSQGLTAVRKDRIFTPEARIGLSNMYGWTEVVPPRCRGTCLTTSPV